MSNWVNIFIERLYPSVPKNYPADIQRISVDVEDSNIFSALSKAYALAVDELAEYETVGKRVDVSTNEFTKADFLSEKHGQIPQGKLRYEEDNWEYYDSHLELCEDFIWVYEHHKEIIDVIRNSNNIEVAKATLKETFDLSDYQVKKLLQFRFDMLTVQNYEKYKAEAAKIKDINISGQIDDKECYKSYIRSKIFKLDKQIKDINTFLLVAEHYSEVIGIIEEEGDDFERFSETMKERFNLCWEQTLRFQYNSIKDFSKKRRAEMRKELEEAIESKKKYEEDLKRFL